MVEKTKALAPFIVQRRDCVLSFPEDSEFHGAEIRAKLDVDIGTFLELQKMSENAGSEQTSEGFRRFGDEIVLEWNLADEDARPVPSNGEGFLTLPPNICTAIIAAWAEEASSVGEA
ncbi:hypothetical protein [uncultured Mediterranean phage uvDeep-CGR2-KM18-C74]|nr:hypothetical protein [uncultured Mediterranean phage uvDeep-CGR2-KM18-C74]